MTVTPVELAKGASTYLRGDVPDELTRPDDPFGAEDVHILKFHGIYQQDDRDARRERTRAGQELEHSCMVRCSVPGGVLRSEQWAVIDDLGDEIANGALRLTSRQGVQFHFVHKGELKPLLGTLNRHLVTTLAACGDVARNVMVASAPRADRDHERLQSLARAIAGRLRPRSEAYWTLWLDGERMVSAGPATSIAPSGDDIEPLYGATYLPRKFKIGVASPGDNSIDVFSQDVGLVPAVGPDGTDGVVVLAGGGLGRSVNDETTFPRLAEPMAWVPDDEAVDVVEAVVTVFRDNGDRTDRKHARLKYLVEERGIGWLRTEVESRLGRTLAAPVELPEWRRPGTDFGWHRQADGGWFLGLPVPGATLVDRGQQRRRTAVREIADLYATEVRVTPSQDILLCGIAEVDRHKVDRLLRHHQVPLAEHLPLTVLSSMACPALPTCGQALGEAERVLPEVVDLIDRLLVDRGLGDIAIETRMTGCPNGCARPYVAELGIVGRTKTAYDIWLGGDPAGTRLARSAIESVPLQKFGDVLGPILDRFASEREEGELFGDWSNRISHAELAAQLPSFARVVGEVDDA